MEIFLILVAFFGSFAFCGLIVWFIAQGYIYDIINFFKKIFKK